MGSGGISANLAFSYDRYGNMTCSQYYATHGYCSYASFDPATNRATLAGTGTPTYDADGNMLTDGITSNTYQYDAEGRLVSVTGGNKKSGNFVYNALGQLVDDNEWNFESMPDYQDMYDPFGRMIGIYETNYAPGWYKEYFPFDGPIAYYLGYPGQRQGLGVVFDNHLGSSRQLGLYGPWGNPWDVNASITEFPNFASFLVYWWCSTIDPWYIATDGSGYYYGLGRWMSTRPYWFKNLLDPQSLNGYAYARNDPTNMVDSGTGAHQPPLPGLDQAGAGNDVPLNATAQKVFSQVYQKTSYLEKPEFYVDWTEDATYTALGLGMAGGVGETLNDAAIALESEAPGTASAVTDFVNGYIRPWAPPASPGGVAGAVTNGVTKLY